MPTIEYNAQLTIYIYIDSTFVDFNTLQSQSKYVLTFDYQESDDESEKLMSMEAKKDIKNNAFTFSRKNRIIL